MQQRGQVLIFLDQHVRGLVTMARASKRTVQYNGFI
jgi:hypothetical protein